MQLTWKASASASCFHAATCLVDGRRPVDARIAAALETPTRELVAEIDAGGLPSRAMLAMLSAFAAAGVENDRQLVQQATTRLAGARAGSEQLVARLAGRVASLEAAFACFDERTTDGDAASLVDELLLRSRPLMQHWDERGKGLLLQLARVTEPDLLAERADVVLVYPVLGGHGVAHLPVNAVSFEAVLANPHADLPEMLRLAWLLAQLNLDLPRYAEHVPRDRHALVVSLAMILPVLSAGEHVEIVRLDVAAVQRAITAWHIATTADVDAVAETLDTWWTTYEATPPAWAVALAALDKMLPS